MEGAPSPNKQRASEIKNREILKGFIPPGETISVADEQKEDRTRTAAEIRGVRRSRDEERAKSKTLIARVRGRLGMTGGSEEFAEAASKLDERAREMLDSKKVLLALKERDRLFEVVEENVFSPLTAAYREQDDTLALASVRRIDREAFAAVLGTTEFQNRFFETPRVSTKKPKTRDFMDQLLAEGIERNLPYEDFVDARIAEQVSLETIGYMEAEDLKTFIRKIAASPHYTERFIGQSADKAHALLSLGGMQAEETLNAVIQADLGSGRFFMIDTLLSAQWTHKEVFRLAFAHLDQYVRSHFGFAADRLAYAWDEGALNARFNLRRMHELELLRPGSVRALNERYGICEYIRYPAEMLIAQLEEEEVQQPYGIVVYPRADHNSAFDQDEEVLASLREQVRGKYGLKIFETGSTLNLARTLITLDKKYGKENKISFAVLGGHGRPERLMLGYDTLNPEIRSVTAADTERQGFKRTADFFVPHPSIILISCSTGAENGLAQRMSKNLGARVTGPDRPTNIKGISVRYDSKGTPIFDATYRDADTEHTYAAGQRVADSNAEPKH